MYKHIHSFPWNCICSPGSPPRVPRGGLRESFSSHPPQDGNSTQPFVASAPCPAAAGVPAKANDARKAPTFAELDAAADARAGILAPLEDSDISPPEHALREEISRLRQMLSAERRRSEDIRALYERERGRAQEDRDGYAAAVALLTTERDSAHEAALTGRAEADRLRGEVCALRQDRDRLLQAAGMHQAARGQLSEGQQRLDALAAELDATRTERASLAARVESLQVRNGMSSVPLGWEQPPPPPPDRRPPYRAYAEGSGRGTAGLRGPSVPDPVPAAAAGGGRRRNRRRTGCSPGGPGAQRLPRGGGQRP